MEKRFSPETEKVRETLLRTLSQPVVTVRVVREPQVGEVTKDQVYPIVEQIQKLTQECGREVNHACIERALVQLLIAQGITTVPATIRVQAPKPYQPVGEDVAKIWNDQLKREEKLQKGESNG